MLKIIRSEKQSELQSLQNPSEINRDNLNNVRREASRYFRSIKREYLKDKISELATKSKKKNIIDMNSGINEFRRVYYPRNNVVRDENGDPFSDCHNIFK
jgi:hypothetical protein